MYYQLFPNNNKIGKIKTPFSLHGKFNTILNPWSTKHLCIWVITMGLFIVSLKLNAQDNSWARKHPITINAGQVDGASNLSNFPILITLDHLQEEVVNDGQYAALNGGGDIRFTSDASGSNPLAIEIVEFVTNAIPANRRVQIWVKIPSLSPTSDTTIYIWYNKVGEVQPSLSSTYGSQAVWSTYEAVWHMDTNPANLIYDVTGNGYDLSSSGNMTGTSVVSGTIGNAISFDGVNDQLTLTNELSLSNSFTFSVWFNWDVGNSDPYGAVLVDDPSTYHGFWLKAGNSVIFYDGQETGTASGSILPNSATRWDFVATSGNSQNYLNGNIDVGNIQDVTSGVVKYMGSDFEDYLSGWIDEIRVSNDSKSSAWLKTEYNNQNNSTAFASAGIPQGTSDEGGSDTQDPTVPTLSSTGQTDVSTDLSWTGATDNIGITGYKIFKDGILETTLVNVNTHQVTNLTAETTYQFTVSALDAVGNESTLSNVLSVTTANTSGGGGSTSSGNWTLTGTDLYHNTGNVAIGTTTVPTGHKLAVNGSIITTEVLVQLKTNWPDYVFKENYELASLEEVAKYIEENGHLMNIPSAAEVETSGIELGEMNKLFLEKIEELTLYIIALKKENGKMLELEKRIILLENNSENN